jgi:hypothetical protein
MWENCIGCGAGLFAGGCVLRQLWPAHGGRSRAGHRASQGQRATVPAGRAPQGGPGRQAVGAPQAGRGPQGGPGGQAGPGPVPAARMGEPGSGLIRIYARPTPPTAAPAADPGSAPDDASFPAAGGPFRNMTCLSPRTTRRSRRRTWPAGAADGMAAPATPDRQAQRGHRQPGDRPRRDGRRGHLRPRRGGRPRKGQPGPGPDRPPRGRPRAVHGPRVAS